LDSCFISQDNIKKILKLEYNTVSFTKVTAYGNKYHLDYCYRRPICFGVVKPQTKHEEIKRAQQKRFLQRISQQKKQLSYFENIY